MNISKKLLSAVLVRDLYLEHLWDLNENGFLYYIEENGCAEYINPFELANRCKVWAFKQKISIRTAHSFKFDGYLIEVFQDFDPMFDTLDLIYSKYNSCEIEGIFEACEFILDNKVPF